MQKVSTLQHNVGRVAFLSEPAAKIQPTVATANDNSVQLDGIKYQIVSFFLV